MTPADKAKELGAEIPYQGGIAWVWSKGFPTMEAGEAFVEWLDENGYEHRGVYPDGVFPKLTGKSSVRWR